MALGNRYSQHSFAKTPEVNSPRSVFNRSFQKKDTYYFDQMMPFFVDEILPGDTCNLNVHCFARLATQVVPLMDNAYLDFFFFYVPNRLVWTNWERFNGAQDDPGDTTDFTVPQMVAPAVTGWGANSIADHFGIPTEIPSISVNALPFRALGLIWNQWFRDQNIQDSLVVPMDDGPDTDAWMIGANGGVTDFAKKHDYFTSGLPWPQKGDAIEIPIGTSAPIVYQYPGSAVAGKIKNANNVGTPASGATWTDGSGFFTTSGGSGLAYDPNGTLVADLTNATAGTINELREAFQIQSLYELDARGGTRYVELLLAHWNVVSPDFRLQRPEFLSSATININSHPVPQTSATDGSSYQAGLASFATASSSGNQIGFSKSFVEHGYVIGLVRARGEVSYQQGLNRMWSRETRFDFFWPSLQAIGEQATLKKELRLMGTSQDNEVFNYQERYAEYKYKPSEICGDFRSNFAQSLDSWHLAQDMSGSTQFDENFLVSATPIIRNLANTTGTQLLVDYWFDYKHARVMKAYSVPASLGRL